MEVLSGYVEHIVYQNPSNGYTVMNVVFGGEEITCVGICVGLGQGENIEAEGEYVTHQLYGKQFQINSYRTVAPTGKDDIERYLASGAIKGIGPVRAALIVKKFGEETLKIIQEQPERLEEVRGISAKMAMEIGIWAEEKKDLRDAALFLQRYGISNALAVKIYDTYGAELYRVIKENPYRLAEDISGIGFKTADEIAERAGIRVDSDYRIRSGIFYVLSQAVGEGHTYLPEDILAERACELLGVE